MHYQKTLQFLQILQIGLAVAGKTLFSLPSITWREPPSPQGKPKAECGLGVPSPYVGKCGVGLGLAPADKFRKEPDTRAVYP